MKVLVLDAMGVIYRTGDDVAELLCPFIHENGGIADNSRIEGLYHDASLGRISAVQFWNGVHLDPKLEDAYLLRHRLSAGVIQFLCKVKPGMYSVWCLSNDVSEWSQKLRERFGLDRYLDGFVISGDVGARKPDPLIYKHLLAETEAKPEEVLFVDDRPRNLDAAAALGLQTILFNPILKSRSTQHRAVSGFDELSDYFCNRFKG